MGSSLKDLKALPEDVQDVIGFALYQAQLGRRHPDARPMQGDLSGVMEIVDRYDGDTYRAMYTVKLGAIVYALHVFQKKARDGIATPKHELDTIRKRLKMAKEHQKTLLVEAKNERKD